MNEKVRRNSKSNSISTNTKYDKQFYTQQAASQYDSALKHARNRIQIINKTIQKPKPENS